MSHPVCKKLERALVEYLTEYHKEEGDALAGVTLYVGHRSGMVAQEDHVVIVANDPGGDLMQSGIYEVEVRVLLVTYAVPQEDEGDEDPAERHSERMAALVGIFSQERMEQVVEVINIGSEESGVGVSGYEVGAGQDARDGQVFASTLTMTWTAHLV